MAVALYTRTTVRCGLLNKVIFAESCVSLLFSQPLTIAFLNISFEEKGNEISGARSFNIRLSTVDNKIAVGSPTAANQDVLGCASCNPRQKGIAYLSLI